MTGLNHCNILPHHRANFEKTEAAMIRFSGLVQALEIVADGITEAEPKSSARWPDGLSPVGGGDARRTRPPRP